MRKLCWHIFALRVRYRSFFIFSHLVTPGYFWPILAFVLLNYINQATFALGTTVSFISICLVVKVLLRVSCMIYSLLFIITLFVAIYSYSCLLFKPCLFMVTFWPYTWILSVYFYLCALLPSFFVAFFLWAFCVRCYSCSFPWLPFCFVHECFLFTLTWLQFYCLMYSSSVLIVWPVFLYSFFFFSCASGVMFSCSSLPPSSLVFFHPSLSISFPSWTLFSVCGAFSFFFTQNSMFVQPKSWCLVQSTLYRCQVWGSKFLTAVWYHRSFLPPPPWYLCISSDFTIFNMKIG